MRQREGSARRRPGPGNPGRPHNDGEGTIRKAPKRQGLGVALILAVVAALAIATPMAASAAPSSGAPPGAPPCNISGAAGQERGTRPPSQRHHRRGRNQYQYWRLSQTPARAGVQRHSPAALQRINGAATCFFSPCDNGNVMMTPSTSPLVVVPIFWDPTGLDVGCLQEHHHFVSR